MVDEISGEEARALHDGNDPYVAVIEENGTLQNVLEFGSDHIVITFYADNRMYLVYDFVKKWNRVFLKGASYYEVNNGEAFEVMSFNFAEDGYTYMEKYSISGTDVDAREYTGDVTANWDEYPQFAEYGRILKSER